MKPLSAQTFDLVAKIFYNEKFLNRIQQAINPMKGHRLLDAACGTGILKPCCSPAWYVGIDIDTKRVIEARNQYKTVDFTSSDAAKLAFKENSFDMILASGLFHHVNDQTAYNILAEFNRVLSADGKIIVIEAIWPQHWYNIFGALGRKLDQGNFVRYSWEYESLFKQCFNVDKKYLFTNYCLEYLLAILVKV
ncbi:MAG: class I SAM-dependent methyltransferase [Desulfobacterales bacterium]|nr:class I SAM-dependent methyltransferase [Desulfobacterales bacterium]